MLDLVLGGGIVPGKIINLVGDRSTGKTLLATEMIAACRAKLEGDLVWVFDDCEAGYNFDSQSMYGFDVTESPLLPDFHPSSTVEEFESNLRRALGAVGEDQTLIYIIDSLDALSSEAEIERSEKRHRDRMAGKSGGAGTYAMEKQKQLSELFRVLVRDIAEAGAVLIVISQVRDNIGVMFGEKYRRSGGKALDFYASAIIWLSEVQKIKIKDVPVGVTIKALAKKNKMGIPFRSAFIKVLFDYGVDDIDSCIGYIYDLFTDTGKERGFPRGGVEWDGQIFKRRGDLIRYIEEQGQERAIARAARQQWKTFEASLRTERKGKYV